VGDVYRSIVDFCQQQMFSAREREALPWNVFFFLVSCFAVRSRVAVVFALSTLLLPNAVEVSISIVFDQAVDTG